MKKLLTLLTLVLCVVVGAKAEDVTVTWLPNDASEVSSAGSASVANVLTVNALAPSTPVTFKDAFATYDSKKWGQFVSSNRPTKNYIAATDYIAFSVTVADGMEFKPTKATAYAVGIGTGNNGVGIYSTIQSQDKKSAATNSSGAASVSQMSVNLSGTYVAGQTVTFYIHIGQNNTTENKGIAIRDVVLTGTYEASSKTTASLSFETVSGNADIAAGTSFTLPTLTKTPSDAVVSYTSSKPSVATVDAASGAVTLVSRGTTVITASFAGNEEYTSAEATFTLTVINSNNKLFGYTEELDESAKTLAARALSEIDNVTLTQIFGSNITNDASTSTTVYLNNTAYTNTSSWRKTVKDTYEEQYVGYDVTIASGYALDLTNVEARILIADDTRYYWYVQILDASGTQLYKTSKDKETTRASSASLSDNLSLTNLTGKISVRLYVKQSGTSKRFSIEKLLLEGTTKVDTRPTYTVTTSVTPVGAGTVTPGSEDAFVEGSNVVLTATANTGYKFVKWTVDEADVVGNPYTITNIAANHTAVATFEALPKITFAKGEGTGTAPSEEYLEAGSYTLPYAFFLYKAGATLTGWNDGENTYAPGASYTVSGDVTFTPVFTDNTVALGTAAVTVNWTFARNAGAPLLNCEGSEIDYVQHVTIEGSNFDAVMHVNTIKDAGISGSTGKLNNTSDASRAQVNKGTVFTIPAVKGMAVTVTYTNGSPTAGAFKFDGNDADAVDGTAKTLTYTYTGSASTINLIDQGKSLYPSGISVEYPALSSVDVTVPATGFTTYVNSTNALNFEGTGITPYVIKTNANATKVSLVAKTSVAAGEPVLLYADGGATMSVPVAATATADADNLLVAGTGAKVKYSDTDQNYILWTNGEGVTGFYRANSTEGNTVAEGKAYLHIPSGSGARFFSLDLDGETTAINSVNVNVNENGCFDLQGRRVAQPTKGLYIVNGKKVVIK